jgi:hypothetical protein
MIHIFHVLFTVLSFLLLLNGNCNQRETDRQMCDSAASCAMSQQYLLTWSTDVWQCCLLCYVPAVPIDLIDRCVTVLPPVLWPNSTYWPDRQMCDSAASCAMAQQCLLTWSTDVWQCCLLCYGPALLFRNITLTTRLLPRGRCRRTFKNVHFYNFFICEIL